MFDVFGFYKFKKLTSLKKNKSFTTGLFDKKKYSRNNNYSE